MLKKIGRNDPCWCGSGKKYKDCHLALDEKINSYKLKGWKIPPKKIIKRPDQIDGIRESGLVNIAVLDYVAENIHAGMSTEDIDRLVAEKTKELGGTETSSTSMFLLFIRDIFPTLPVCSASVR